MLCIEVFATPQGEAGKPGVPGRDGVPGKDGIPGLPGKQVCVCVCSMKCVPCCFYQVLLCVIMV